MLSYSQKSVLLCGNIYIFAIQFLGPALLKGHCYWLTYRKTILEDTEFILVQPKTHLKNFLQSRFT